MKPLGPALEWAWEEVLELLEKRKSGMPLPDQGKKTPRMMRRDKRRRRRAAVVIIKGLEEEEEECRDNNGFGP